jgi:hypothetical protein
LTCPECIEAGKVLFPEEGPEMKYDNGQNIERIENNFKYHPPKNDQPERYELIRAGALRFAQLINGCCPHSRELSTALTDLEKVVFNANAAIARNE